MQLPTRSTHSDRLERWLGTAEVEALSASMRNWYGPPIALSGVPGSVWVCKGGDFCGPIKAGKFCNAVDYVEQRLKYRYRKWLSRQASTMNSGFASLADLIQEATKGGKLQVIPFHKTGLQGDSGGISRSAWLPGALPPAGANGAAAPGGTVAGKTTTGAMKFQDAQAGDTTHFAGGIVVKNALGAVLLYDRLFFVIKTMSSTVTEAVTGVPTRYQSATSTADDYAGGNFCVVECGSTALGALCAWTVCKYTNEAGTAGQTFGSTSGRSGPQQDEISMGAQGGGITGQWFFDLQAGDVGVKALTQMQAGTSTTGTINFAVGHPLAYLLAPVAAAIGRTDGINSAFSMVRVFDNACLALLMPNEISAASTAATGNIRLVSG